MDSLAKKIFLAALLIGCTAKKVDQGLNDLKSSQPGIIDCIEIKKGKSQNLLNASIEFNASGTVAEVSIRSTKFGSSAPPPLSIRTAFEYKSLELPSQMDLYSFKSKGQGSFVLSSEVESGKSTAEWRKGNKSVSFDCSLRASDSPFTAESQGQIKSVRCFEVDADSGWILDVRVENVQSGKQSEVTLQRTGQAPNTRKAKQINEPARPVGDSSFLLVISRSERIRLNLEGPSPAAVWSKGATETSFSCPENFTH